MRGKRKTIYAVKKQPQYKILSGLAILMLLSAVLTIFPHPAASKVNLLGYKSLCAFVPLSTLILLGAAGFVRIFRDTQYRSTRAVTSEIIAYWMIG
jgi:hypothetical protein